ncbi:uncharacterized protein LOC124499580 [Dermatophagoides farinae]|uniref:uncharacterized protein LOC124499580 n=1 Tax=Dermatophagoides farinae TaxID=6954 RepID=UPI003F63A545
MAHNHSTFIVCTPPITLILIVVVCCCCCCLSPVVTVATSKCSNGHQNHYHHHQQPRSLLNAPIPFYSAVPSKSNSQQKPLTDLTESASDFNSIVAAVIASAVDSSGHFVNGNSKQRQSQLNPPPSTTLSSTTPTTTISSVSATSSTAAPISVDNLLMDAGNYTNFVDNGDYVPFYSNYFLSPSTAAAAAAAGSLYPVDLGTLLPSTSYQQNHVIRNSNSNNNNNNKNKTTIGLGRRIGELVSTSAEKATRAFKSFPKLLNDIKPSKLLGLSSSSVVDTIDLITPKHNISSIPLPSSWYLPQNTWSSFAPPPLSSSLFLQQPVFMRTPESQTTNQILPPSTMKLDFQSNRGASQQNVYPNDLYASAQTLYGNRVKPPRDQREHRYHDFDNSGEAVDDPDHHHQDTKMANDGHMDDGDDNLNHNHINGGDGGGVQHNDHHLVNDVAADNGWQHHHSGEDYGEQSNIINNHNHNHNNHNNNNNNDFYQQPHFNGNNNQGLRGVVNPVNGFAASSMRRPPFPTNFRSPASTLSLTRPRPYSDAAEVDNWYPAFFGPSVKPMNPRLRNVVPSYHYSAANSLLNPTTATEYMPFMRPTEAPAPLADHSQLYGNRPSWPSLLGGYYPHSNQQLLYNYPRPNSMMAAAGSMMRPMFFPPINQYYHMQRYRSSLPYMSPYFPSTAPIHSPIAPYRVSGGPYGHQSAAFNSLVTAASSLYPVRVAFSPIATAPLSYPILPTTAMTQIPMLRHRIGPLSRRPEKVVNKRVDNSANSTNSTVAINKYSEPMYVTKLNSTSVAIERPAAAAANQTAAYQTHRMMRSYRHSGGGVFPKSDQINNEWRPVFKT